MRLLTSSLLLLALFGFSSCDPDKAEDDSTSNELLLGTWELEAATGVGKSTTTYQGTSYDADFTSRLVEPSDYRIIFDGNGKASGEGDFYMELTTTFDGQTTTQTVGMSDVMLDGPYELQGNVIVTENTDGEQQNFKIVTLTETDLVMELDIDRTRTINGTEAHEKQSLTYEMRRAN